MTEKHVKQRVKRILQAYPGVWYFMPVPMYNAGIPDFVGCCRGRMFAIETKLDASKRGPTALQARTMRLLQDAGAVVWVVDRHTVQDFEAVFKEELDL